MSSNASSGDRDGSDTGAQAPPPAPAYPCVIHVCGGPEAGRVYPLTSLPCVVGRGRDADLSVVDDAYASSISRVHLRIETWHRKGVLMVRDCSRNGSRTGNAPIPRGEAVEWRIGESLQLGSSSIVLRLLLAEEACSLPTLEHAVEADGTPSARGQPGIRSVSADASAPKESLWGGLARRLRTLVPLATPRPPVRLEALADPVLLRDSWHRVALHRGAHGIDGVRIDDFRAQEDDELESIRKLLLMGRYQPLPAREIYVQKRRGGGVRRLCVLTIRDRIVQGAVTRLLEPHFEPSFSDSSYAYRAQMSAHHALRRIDQDVTTLPWIVESDIADFFESVDHARLLALVRRGIEDCRVVEVVMRCLSLWQAAPGRGIAQGAATSPLFSNLFLTSFDHHISQRYRLVRFGDDFVLLCADRPQAQEALLEAESFLREELSLVLRPEKTRIVSLASGFSFLGFRFDTSGRRPDDAAISALGARLEKHAGEATRRRQLVQGWRSYFGLTGEGQLKQGTLAVLAAEANPGDDPVNLGMCPGPDSRAQAAAAGSPLEEEEAHASLTPASVADRFLALFEGRQEVHARQWVSENGRCGYLPCDRELEAADVEAHVRGECTLAVFLQDPDGNVPCLLLDVDGPRDAQVAPPAAVALAWAIHREGRRHGLPLYVEDSGRRGRHVWLFFSHPCPGREARSLGRLLLGVVGGPRVGASCEIFPREDRPDGLGPQAKLPFGIHRRTGRRCSFLREEDVPFESMDAFITQVKRVTPEQARRAGRRIATAADPPRNPSEHPEPQRDRRTQRREGTPVHLVLKACPLLQRVAERPLQTGHLSHLERLILLYTFGHLGRDGARFIHQVMARCDNYSPPITQAWIDKLDDSRGPLGCARIQDWLSERDADVRCTCSRRPKGTSGSPVHVALGEGTRGRRAERPNQNAQERGARGQRDHGIKVETWKEVAADLFSTLAEEPDECPPST